METAPNAATAEPYVTQHNPFAQGFALDPFPVYKELREAAPIVWLEKLGVWGVFRDQHVRELQTDVARFTVEGGTGLQNLFRETPWREPSLVQEKDPPYHTKTRAILTRIMSPRALMALKAPFKTEADALVARLIARETFDGVEDFSKAFVSKVFLDGVGVPPDERENVIVYNDLVRKSRTVKISEWPQEDRDKAEAVASWLTKFCSRESMSPGSFGAALYDAVDAGEISEHEGNMLVRTFISAGTETTIAAIGQTLYYLATNPDQWAIVKADPSKVRAAFEETLRLDPPAQFGGRCAREEMIWEGVRIGQHDKILGFFSSANRDPSRWDNPDEFNILRNHMGHLGLGTGIHGCVGQMIARQEADILLRAVVEQVDRIEVGTDPQRNLSGFRGFRYLPLKFIPN